MQKLITSMRLGGNPPSGMPSPLGPVNDSCEGHSEPLPKANQRGRATSLLSLPTALSSLGPCPLRSPLASRGRRSPIVSPLRTPLARLDSAEVSACALIAAPGIPPTGTDDIEGTGGHRFAHGTIAPLSSLPGLSEALQTFGSLVVRDPWGHPLGCPRLEHRVSHRSRFGISLPGSSA